MKKLFLLAVLLCLLPCVRAAQLGVQYDTVTRRMGPTKLVIDLLPLPGGATYPILHAGTNSFMGLHVPTNGVSVGINTNVTAAGSALHVRASVSGPNTFRIDDTNGTRRMQFGVYPGFPQFSGIWFGDVTPTTVNHGFLGDSSSTYLNVASGGNLYLSNEGTVRWNLSPSGHWLTGTDNTYDIGASGATRPRNLYIAGFMVAPSGIYVGSTGSGISSPGDGIIRFANNADNNLNAIQWGGITAAFPAIGRTNGDLVVFGGDRLFAGGDTNRLLIHGGLVVGPPGTAGTLTNTLYASSTLDFPSTVAGTVSDLVITVAGAADGDVVALGEPSGSIGPLTGVFNAWASNGVVFVRFANNNLVTAQDPASGTFKVRVDKFK